MSLSHHEFWTVLHGLLFGSLYLLVFAGGAAGLLTFPASEAVALDGDAAV